MLTGYLRDGTEYLSASTVRRVVQVASMSVVGSAIAVSRLDKEVRRVTVTYPDEDLVTLADHMVRMCEEEGLDWMRTRRESDRPGAGRGSGKDLGQGGGRQVPSAGLQGGRVDDEGAGAGHQGALLC